METENYSGRKVCRVDNIITGNAEELLFEDGILNGIHTIEHAAGNNLFIGPGLIDMQVNGINGIDFNDPALSEQQVIDATHYLLSQGVTTFFPTVITNSDENVLHLMRTIYNACLSNALVNDCIGGIHLEGPFISKTAGAKGAHDEQYIKAPDWELFNRFQEAAGGKIKLITLAPEWDEAPAFIEKCTTHGMIVSIGHTMANAQQVARAIEAGASMCTHIGNAVPLQMPRHPNIIWELLAADELYASIITDGLHLPKSFIKVVMKTKGIKTIIVSDATCFAGMAPGTYQNHIGGTVILDEEKRISLKSSPGLLAGAAKSLLENVAFMVNNNLATLSEAWQMASTQAANLLSKTDDRFISSNDKVLFKVTANEIQVEQVIKNGRVVFFK